MTVEELLKPRYKVIADWPENTFDIGQILIKSDRVEDWLQTDNFLHGFKLSAAEKYPYLFKKLHWADERNKNDMPLFIKDKEGRIWSIKEWKKDLLGRCIPINNIDREGDTENFASISWHFTSGTIIPSTEQEYLSYIESLKQNT